MVVTEKCDIYSFGVVALETLMGGHPRELVAAVSSSSSPPGASAYQNMLLHKVIDQRLPVPTSRQVVQDIHVIAKLALACIHADPKHRPTMKHVSQEILIACGAPLATNFHDISLGDLMKNSPRACLVDGNECRNGILVP